MQGRHFLRHSSHLEVNLNNHEFRQLQPTPARGKFKEEMLRDPQWVAEEKLDGDRRIGQFVLHHPTIPIVRFTGRRVSDVDGLMVEKTDRVPHLSGFPQDGLVTIGGKIIPIPLAQVPIELLGTVLDGEFVVKNGRSKDVTSIIGSLPDRAVMLQSIGGWIEWRVFDCLWFKGTDIRDKPLEYRRKCLLSALLTWGNPYAVAVPQVKGKRKETLFSEIVAAHGEGVILKHTQSAYHEEKLWVKMKKELTEDVVILGYDDPEKESTKVSGKTSATKFHQKGWIGAIRVGQYKELNENDPEHMTIWREAQKIGNASPFFITHPKSKKKMILVYCGSVSGMNDMLREELSNNKSTYVGRTIEILANEREPTGKFRHPRFLRFRNDKNSWQCLWGR